MATSPGLSTAWPHQDHEAIIEAWEAGSSNYASLLNDEAHVETLRLILAYAWVRQADSPPSMSLVERVAKELADTRNNHSKPEQVYAWWYNRGLPDPAEELVEKQAKATSNFTPRKPSGLCNEFLSEEDLFGALDAALSLRNEENLMVGTTASTASSVLQKKSDILEKESPTKINSATKKNPRTRYNMPFLDEDDSPTRGGSVAGDNLNSSNKKMKHITPSTNRIETSAEGNSVKNDTPSLQKKKKETSSAIQDDDSSKQVTRSKPTFSGTRRTTSITKKPPTQTPTKSTPIPSNSNPLSTASSKKAKPASTSKIPTSVLGKHKLSPTTQAAQDTPTKTKIRKAPTATMGYAGNALLAPPRNPLEEWSRRNSTSSPDNGGDTMEVAKETTSVSTGVTSLGAFKFPAVVAEKTFLKKNNIFKARPVSGTRTTSASASEDFGVVSVAESVPAHPTGFFGNMSIFRPPAPRRASPSLTAPKNSVQSVPTFNAINVQSQSQNPANNRDGNDGDVFNNASQKSSAAFREAPTASMAPASVARSSINTTFSASSSRPFQQPQKPQPPYFPVPRGSTNNPSFTPFGRNVPTGPRADRTDNNRRSSTSRYRPEPRENEQPAMRRANNQVNARQNYRGPHDDDSRNRRDERRDGGGEWARNRNRENENGRGRSHSDA